MANMYNISDLTMTTKDNPEWFTRAAFGGRLIEGGYIRALTDIKNDTLINQINLENEVLQIDGRNCAWTPNQIIKLSDKKASVKKYKINLEECIDDLEKRRTIHMLSPGAKNDSLPDELEEATLWLLAISLSNEIEKMIIGGNEATNPNHFNGMVQTLLNSPVSNQVAGTILTPANILDNMVDMYDALPETALQDEDAGDLRYFVNYKDRRKARKALTTINNQVLIQDWSIDDTDKKNPKIYYLGVEVVAVKGMPENTMVLIDSNNAFLLTDLMSDLEEIELFPREKPYDNIICIRGGMYLGFMIPFEDEAVIMSPLITDERVQPDEMDLRVVPTNLVFPSTGATAQTFTVITADPAAAITVAEPDGLGFTATAGTTTAGVTTVTVTPEFDNTGNITNRTAQVVVSINGKNRYATVMLEQAYGMETKPIVETPADPGDPEVLIAPQGGEIVE